MLDEYRRRVLPNGLRVVGVERPELHYFVCSVYIHAGPRFEAPYEVGLTHFLEHMLVQGSESFPSSSAIMRGVEDLGGVIDGQTHPEFLGFTFGVHRKHWAKVMEIASDVLLHPLFDPQEIEQEKLIITQEVSQYRDRDGRNISASELVYGLLFQERIAEVGTRGGPQVMQHFDRDMIFGHYRRFFVPANMVICLAGSFDFDAVTGELAECFGRMELREVPELPAPEVNGRRARAIYRHTESLPVVEALLSYHAFPLGDERFDAIRAVSQLLGGGLSSRLFAQVRENLGLVYDVQSHVQAYSDSGALSVSLAVGPENLTEAVEAVKAELQSLLSDGFSGQELERYKESARCGMDILCDRPAQLADWFGKQELFLGLENLRSPRDYVQAQQDLMHRDLSVVMQQVLVEWGSNFCVVGPFGEEEAQALRALLPAEEPAIEPVAPPDGA